MPLKPLFTAHARAVGGRNGHAESSDKLVSVNLSVPKTMGGPGKPGAATPEDLFAAGYAACFGGAVEYAAKLKKLPASDIAVDADVTLGTTDAGAFGLSVHLAVSMRGVSQAQADDLVSTAHEQICPYSHATRNNVVVTLKASVV